MAALKQNCQSFKASVDNNSQLLILGSMPGVKSLEEQQYYAHPQNRFWKLMGKICNTNNLSELDYKDKLQILLKNKIALWDVIQSCERNGSLDSNIQNDIPNNIAELLRKFLNIKVICLNGNKSYSAFKKYFPELLRQYKCYHFPSTSPANAVALIVNAKKKVLLPINFLAFNHLQILQIGYIGITKITFATDFF